MSQTKYKLPDDLKIRCIALVRGYKRMLKEYGERRYDIIYSSPHSDDQPKGSGIGDINFSKTVKLQKLEESYDAKAIKAVDTAKLHIGLDIANEKERQKLTEAIWDSCIQGRNFILAYRNLCVGKDNFYERRRGFLYEIAVNMGFIHIIQSKKKTIVHNEHKNL